MAEIKADRFTALKAKVKAECLRRSHSGSVAEYGGAAYDYTETPAAGRIIRQEHRDKLIEPMRAVNSDAVPEAQGTVNAEELSNLETRVTVWAARSISDQSGSDCQSGCTGACYTGCATGCSGCSGCSGCGSSCPTGCSECSGGCSGCGSGCPTGCSGCTNCVGGCQGCGSGCPDACGSGCSGKCSGCGASCPTGCSDGCSGGCGTLANHGL